MPKLPKPKLSKPKIKTPRIQNKTARKVSRFKPIKYLFSIITLPFDFLKFIIVAPSTVLGFLNAVRNELRLVTWFSRRDTIRWSTGVIITAILFGTTIALFDVGLFKLRSILIDKL